MELSDILPKLGPKIDFYPGLRRITGSTRSALLYSCMLTMRPTDASADGWFERSSEELVSQTGLSLVEQARARRELIQCGLLEERCTSLEDRMLFRVKGFDNG